MVACSVAFKVTAEMQQLQSPSCGEDKTLKNSTLFMLCSLKDLLGEGLFPYNGGQMACFFKQ